MPLCTIFTKCPAPTAPQCKKPRAAVLACAAPDFAPRARLAKIGLQTRDHVALAANHQTEALLKAEHAAARADVDVMNPLLLKLAGAADVVMVVGVAAVDDDVIFLQQWRKLAQHLIDDRRRHHQPGDARRRKRGHEILERMHAARPVGAKLLHRIV